MPHQFRQQLILVAIGCVLLFTRLGATHVWDVDEAIFSQAAREMADRGDWVVPYFNGEIFPDKPALMYWWMIAAYKLFGPTEFAARFWSAVFALGTMLVTYRIGRRLFGPAVGFWGGIVLGSSLNFAIIARAATPDSFLVFFSTLAMWFFVAGTVKRPEAGNAEHERPKDADVAADTATAEPSLRPASLTTWLAVYAAMGFAVLDKGPVGVVLPTAAIGLFLLTVSRRMTQPTVRQGCLGPKAASPSEPASASAAPLNVEPAANDSPSRRLVARAGAALGWLCRTLAPRHLLGTIWTMRPLTALAAVLVVAGPWYAWVGVQTHGVWLQNFLGVHNVGRFLHPMENHQGPIFYYIPAIVFGFFPWSLFVILGLAQLVGRLGQKHDKSHPWRIGYVFVLSWAAAWIGFFSLASTKLPSYIVPAYPALALATACLVCGWVADPSTIARVWLRVGWSLLAVAGVGTLLIGPILANVFLNGDMSVGLIGIVPLSGAAVCLFYSERGRPSSALAALAVTAVAFLVGLSGFVVPRVDRHQTSAQLAEVISRNKPAAGIRVGSYGYFRPSLVFYAHQPIEQLNSREQVGQFFDSQPEGAFLVTTDEQYQQIVSALPRGVTILESSPRFLQPGKVLLLGRSATGEGPPAWPGSPGALEAGKRRGTARH